MDTPRGERNRIIDSKTELEVLDGFSSVRKIQNQNQVWFNSLGGVSGLFQTKLTETRDFFFFLFKLKTQCYHKISIFSILQVDYVMCYGLCLMYAKH